MNFSAFYIETFIHPLRLWLLLIVPVLIGLYIWALYRKAPSGIRYTKTTLMQLVMPLQSQWLRHLAVAATLVSLVFLNIAWAEPAGINKVPRERATIVLLIDVSQSMGATDIAPSRLAAAKSEAEKFVDQVPAKYNIALISMSRNADVLAAATKDRSVVKRAIQELKLSDTTAIGEGIFTALQVIKNADPEGNKDPVPGVIVLLSDGGSNYGRAPAVAAEAAAKQKVPIFTISYGTDYGYVDLDGTRYPVPPNPGLMQEISTISNGKSWSAKSASDLSSVYRNLQSSVTYVDEQAPTTDVWAGLGLVFAFLAGFATLLMGARLA